MKPIEYFDPELSEPSNYDQALPNFCNAYICASISQLCYKSSVETQHTDQQYKNAVYTVLEEWGWSLEEAEKTIFINSREILNEDGSKTPGTQGLILFYHQTAFIAFRGSEQKLNDWLTNFNLMKVTPITWQEGVETVFAKGEVHRGFLKAFNAMIPDGGQSREDFAQVIEKLRLMKNIWITGHSLGGAIAAIATSYLIHLKIPVSGIYLFGAPRVGDPDYRQYMNKNLTYKYWRLMHKNDLVPDVPLPQIFNKLKILKFLSSRALVTGFSRDGCMLRLLDESYEVLRRVDKNGERQVLHHYNGTTARHHSIQLYRDRILTLVRHTKPEFPQMTFEKLEAHGFELKTTEKDIQEIEKLEESVSI